MKNLRFAGSLMACALLTACGSGSPGQDKASAAASASAATPAHATSSAAPKPEAATAANASDKASAITAPTPGQVLSDIYQMDSHGAVSMDVGNGSQASYWYGYAFELGGKHYFTGFAYDTPDKFGKQDDLPGPDSKVTLTDGTYENTAAPGAAEAWTLRVAERDIGEFGSFEHADSIDEQQSPQSFPTKDGRLLLALPTWYLASGVRGHSFAIFVFNPQKPEDPQDTRWTYLGDVASGEDNSAACDANGDGNHMPCVKSSGALSFVSQDGSALPVLHVVMSGTVVDGPSKTRTLGPADAQDYHYDVAKKTYEAPSAP